MSAQVEAHGTVGSPAGRGPGGQGGPLALRTRFGSPKRWLSPGAFGVLLSSAPDASVVDHTYDHLDAPVPFTGANQASEYGGMVRSVQPGIEFEVMRLEDGQWRDFMGRTPAQTIEARWART